MEIYFGGIILGTVLWILCAYYCYQVAPRFQRSARNWGILGILFGPIALMVLYILPHGHHVSDKGRGAQPGQAGHKDHKQADLYEVPKKH